KIMKQIDKILLIVIVLLSCAGEVLVAQTDTSFIKQHVNLNQFLQVVSENNLEFAAEKYNVQISEAAIEMARVVPDPTFSFDWLENREQKERSGFGYASELGTTVEFGKRRARVGLAKSELSVTQAKLDDYFRNLRADAALVFLEAEKQNQLYLIKQKSYLTMKKLADADSIRLELGSIMETDAIQSKLEAGMLMNELLQADANWRNALHELNLFAGVSAIDTLFIPQIRMKGILRSFNLNSLIEVAVQNRSDVVSAKLNMEVSAKNRELVKRERNIDLDLKLGLENDYSLPNSGSGAKIISAGVGIPLKFSNFNKGEINAAELFEQQTEKQFNFVTQKITNEIVKAYQYFLSTEKQVINYQENLLKQSEHVLKGKIYSYDRGETSLLEVLNAQRTFNEIQSSYIEILVDNYMALVDLERTAGIWDISF
ncbi:MAG: TolC family protein, partial [Draconibacterium sp.]|nr:TolC family protein [Draconibacterium sp.]